MPVDAYAEGAAEGEEALVERLAEVGEALLVAADLAGRELSLVLTDDAQIRALNAEWRGEDKATDVLSFAMDEGELLLGPEDEAAPLGDVVISVEYTAAEAEKLAMPRDDLAVFLLVHGFCHLLGYDHAEPDEAAAMRAEEDRLLAAVAPTLTRPPTPY
ncbi:MAG: rRNA maturation RNase YbeY [Deltaproteobacteria bacterium HGW-Deltaproteobacteria-14]|jgi:probable rRNA maturation factor|nr:MAG: rRNA maturation RNase YbeY [Deltaproteobacteria bacterium HGW-Deltaproteobacteria-14]